MVKIMKRISIFFVALCSLLFVSCGGPKPQEVTINFLDAYTNGEYEKAYEYVSSATKNLVPFDVFSSTLEDAVAQLGELSVVLDFVMGTLEYEITEVEEYDDSAAVTYNVSMINLEDPSFTEAFITSLLGCVGMEDPDEISTKIAIDLSQTEIAKTTSQSTMQLIKEDGQWKVILRTVDDLWTW